MRLLVTADLHFNHTRSQPLAEDVIAQMNRAGGDVLLVVGDTAAFDGHDLETCLELFHFRGPKLFVAGNHELWTHGEDSYHNFRVELPRRVRSLGWNWLESEPFTADDFAIIGNIGWYDYSFAPPELGIPHRFYAAKVSPGAAEHLPEYLPLLEQADDVPAHARELIARWNDGKFVKLHRSDEDFLDERLKHLKSQLDTLRDAPQVVAAVHHVPFAELLPPRRNIQWDFARAYLGSGRIGHLLLNYPNVRRLFCGHSHAAIEAQVQHVHGVNIGSAYRAKRFVTLEI
jgi:predicted phosphodiesterase